MQKWEYHTHVEEISAEELRTLGEQGWELVGIIKLNADVNYYFKRPLAKKEDPGANISMSG